MSAYVRLIGRGWWLQLKMRSRSAFEAVLDIVYPLIFATSVFMIYRQGGDPDVLVTAAVGASAMGVWTAVSTAAATSLHQERRQGTLELLATAPVPFAIAVVPMTLAMATMGLYSLVTTLLWGRFVFGIPLSLDHPAVFALAAVATAVGVALMGFLMAVTAIRYRDAWALGTALEMPIWLVCGFVVPLSMLPTWVGPISWVLPPTWGISALQSAAAGEPAWGAISLCLGLSLLYGAAGVVLSRRLLDAARAHATLALT